MRQAQHTERNNARSTRMRDILAVLRMPVRPALLLAFLAFISSIGMASSLVLLIEAGLRITAEGDGAAILGLSLASQSLTVLFVGAIVAAVVVFLADLLAARQSAKIVSIVQRRIRTALFDAYAEADWVTMSSDAPGHLQDVTNTNVSRSLMLTSSINSGLVAVLTLCTMVSAAIFISPLATVILLAVLGTLIASLTPLARRIRRASERLRAENHGYATQLAEVTSVPTEIHTFGVSAAARARHTDKVERVADAHRSFNFIERAVPSLQRNLALIAVLGVLALVHQAGIARAGELGAVVVLLGRSLSFANAIQQVFNRFAAAGPFVMALGDEIERYETRRRDAAVRTDVALPAAPTLHLDEVSYLHPNASDAALTDVSFDLDHGTYLAVVGPSGSGKTTLAEILLGLRTPTSGRYRVADTDLATLDITARADAIAYVPQRPSLITGSIADNVRFLRTGITDDHIYSALERAGLQDQGFLRDLDTELDPADRGLSGGQLQRLAIARALAGRPRVIVFDEPTSALDPDAELAIRSTLAELAGSVTLVVIAHRLSTIDGCDRVLVLDHGRVVADGAPADMAASSDFWRRGFDDSETEQVETAPS